MARLFLLLTFLGLIVVGGISASTQVSYACDPSPCPAPSGGGK